MRLSSVHEHPGIVLYALMILHIVMLHLSLLTNRNILTVRVAGGEYNNVDFVEKKNTANLTRKIKMKLN